MSKGLFLPKKTPKRRTVWLVTFGDLLTLLLCFFLSTVALPLRTNRQQVADINKTLPARSPQNINGAELTTAGTLLAPSREEPLGRLKETPSREVEIREGFFDPGSSNLSEEGSRKLKTSPLSAGYKLESAEIQFCADEKRHGRVGEQRFSTGRLLAVRSQLIDTGVPPERVRMKAGSVCNNEGTERSRDFAGTIRFSLRKSDNG